MRSDPLFQRRLIQLEANYQWGTGKQVLESLLADPTLVTATLNEPIDGHHLYVMDSQVGRVQTLQALLLEASIHVTNALVVAEATQLVPVSDDPFFCQLLALRTSDQSYIADSNRLAAHLGVAVAKSVLPDQLLENLEMRDLFEYRRSAKDAYDAWSQEIEKLALRLSDLPPESLDNEVRKILLTEVKPKLRELHNEMASARDHLFGDLIKAVTKWELPTMSLAYMTSMNLATAIAAFAGALAPAVPPLVDYFNKRRELTRRNSMAYLVGVSSTTRDEH